MAVKRRNGFICKWKLVRMHDTTNAFFSYSWRTCPSDGRNTRTTLLTDFTVSFTSRLHPHQSINLCEWIRSECYKPSMTQEVSQIQSLPPIIDWSKIQLSDFYWGALAFHMADPSGSSTAKRVIRRWKRWEDWSSLSLSQGQINKDWILQGGVSLKRGQRCYR